MSYDLSTRLVVGVSSSALFNLDESDGVFRTQGEVAYRQFQEAHVDDRLEPGDAMPFIQRLLSLNDLRPAAATDPLVEVIVLSRNSPDTGARVMRSVRAHGLPISRAIFQQGRSPFEFMGVMNMSLFLSANADDVRAAVELGHPAGRILPSKAVDDVSDMSLRIAFDFDGVLADDSAETVYQQQGLFSFQESEVEHVEEPLPQGPLSKFLREINKIQTLEDSRLATDSEYLRRVRVSIVTNRNSPADERALNSLKQWGITVNDAFFLGGIAKGPTIGILKPHIFFDDQMVHLASTADFAPSVHIPFGQLNAVVAIEDQDPSGTT